jgi:hypothetical protein
MQSLKWLTGAAVALSLTATPVLAQSGAASLSLSKASVTRVATKAKKSSRIAPPPVVPIVVLVAIIAGAVLVGVSEDADGPPASP